MQAIVNGRIYTPRRIVGDGAVLLEDGEIIAVDSYQRLGLAEDIERLDAQGCIVCPGFVDMHVHGGDGADSVDGSEEAVRTVAARHLRAGTTSLAPTTSTAPIAQIWRAFDSIVTVKREPRKGEARVLGIHMEGPFFAPSQRGAHHPDLLRMPDAAERERLYSYAKELLCVTLAPEREGALEMIARLAREGVLVAGGHSDALYAEVCRAMQAGLSHIIHLWSSMSTVSRIGPKRYSGMLEAALVEEDLTAEIISDGYHLPSSLIKIAVRIKGVEKLCLVSDAMRGSGLGPGQYEVCGLDAIVEEGGGVALRADRQAFAGSISTIQQCLKHTVQVVGLALPDALQMATLTPARILGLDDRIGRLAPGRWADLLLLDPATLEPERIMLDGAWVDAGQG